jgi:hypothetical protein
MQAVLDVASPALLKGCLSCSGNPFALTIRPGNAIINKGNKGKIPVIKE